MRDGREADRADLPVDPEHPVHPVHPVRPVNPGEMPSRPGFLGSRLARVFPSLGMPGGYALLALYAATALSAVVFAVALAGAVVRAVTEGPRAEPVIEARFRWRGPPEVRLSGAASRRVAADGPSSAVGDESPDGAEAQAVGGAVVRWRDEEKLRRAAGILLLDGVDGDYEGAMELLLQISGEDSRAFALDRAAHGKVLARLRGALLREREALGAFLRGLSGTATPPRAEPLAIERFLALPPEELHLPRCAEALPERVALCFIGNVHVRLARETGANDTLLALVLGLGFRQGSDAARVYWESFPEDYVPYEEYGHRASRPRAPTAR